MNSFRVKEDLRVKAKIGGFAQEQPEKSNRRF